MSMVPSARCSPFSCAAMGNLHSALDKDRQSDLPGQQTALALRTYFCETTNVVEPFRAVLRSNVVTGADRIPWKEYLPPVPLTPLSVILPINCPVWALNRVSVSDDTWLVASTLRLRFFTTSSALVMAGKSIVLNRVAVTVEVTPLSVAVYVMGVSTATGMQVILNAVSAPTGVSAGRFRVG